VNARQEPRGTVGHPYSALNLRLALAIFGLVFFTGCAVALFWLGLTALAWVATAIALIAVVNIIVVQRRRIQRARREPGEHHSLFE
jgi:FtsH-binding integral membrane protein